jgi:abhydrolase domain-containing protein 6
MVKTLALLDSGGVVSPEKSELALSLEKGINPLVVNNVDDFDKLLQFNFVKPIEVPYVIKNYLTKQAMKAAPLNKKIFKELQTSDFISLEGKLGKIKAPTLIVWGDTDRVIHISAAGVFKKRIKNAKLVIIKECGHLPMMEKPEETASAYLNFLKSKI